jgi:hypothetical protein
MGLHPAWIQTSLHICAVWSGSMLFAISFPTCNRVCKRTAMDAQAGLDPCWSQTHYVGFVVTQFKCFISLFCNQSHNKIWFSFSFYSWKFNFCPTLFTRYLKLSIYNMYNEEQLKVILDWEWDLTSAHDDFSV